jgi:hypothetical protein
MGERSVEARLDDAGVICFQDFDSVGVNTRSDGAHKNCIRRRF